MIHRMLPQDRGFVFHSWMKSYMGSPSTNGHLMGKDFSRAYTPMVDGILDRATTDVLVNPEDPETIWGWVCYTQFPKGPLAIHFIFVKWLMRDRRQEQNNPGFGLLLLGHAGVSRTQFATTFRTKAWDAYARKHMLNCEYTPQLRSQV